MVQVNISLNPFGRGNRNTIGEIRIINDGTGTAANGNYDVQLIDDSGNTHNIRVEGFERSRGIFSLISETLKLMPNNFDSQISKIPTLEVRDLLELMGMGG